MRQQLLIQISLHVHAPPLVHIHVYAYWLTNQVVTLPYPFGVAWLTTTWALSCRHK